MGCCNKLSNIAIGFNNLAKGINKALGEQRLAICNACPDRKGIWCKQCTCVVKAKTLVPGEFCPLGLWKAI